MERKNEIKRVKLVVAYDGTAYSGWQLQPNGITIEEVLNRELSDLLREEIRVIGASRTDAGVHARMMVAHFETAQEVDTQQLTYKLNKFLRQSIAIQKIVPVVADMHARFSATARTYRYFIHTRKDPFETAYSCLLLYPLDFPMMNEAAKILMEYDDFGAFCKSHTDVKTTLCQISHAEWVQIDDHRWSLEITANRFLRNMVRAVVGTLIEVGRHRITLDGFRKVIESGQRTSAGESMPGHALFLEDIRY